jgi:4-hydroxybenzoate polyprenyltransferase
MGLDHALRLVLFIPISKKAADAATDTIYACQDRKDDVKVGVKSTAVMLGDFVRPFTFSCAVLFVATLAYAGILNEQTPYFFYITVGGTSLHLIWQYITVDLDNPDSCGCELPSRPVLSQVLLT